MPEAGEQPAKPLRTWRPMLLWTGAIVAATGLAWFVAAVAIPFIQVRTVIERTQKHRYGYKNEVELIVEDLGGAERGAAKVALYFRMPHGLAPEKLTAVYLAACCGPRGAPMLTSALGNSDPEVRQLAAFMLSTAGRDYPPAFRALIRALADREAQVRREAAEALGRIGPAAQEAAPALEELLNDKDEAVRHVAAWALKKIRGEEAGK